MKIFIADYLPLANKGEEEILRGIETLFNKEGTEKISFSVFGDVTATEKVGNVKVYPKNICYPDYGYKGKVWSLISIILGLYDIISYYPYKRNIKKQPNLIEDIYSSDIVLIGHDGFFNIRCAMLANYLHRNGIEYGILGAGFNKPSNSKRWLYNIVFRKCFNNANYVILREKTAYNYVKFLSSNPKIYLYPDPAFFCPENDYNVKRVEDVISKYGICKGDRIKIGLTVCEDSISFSCAFRGVDDKTRVHRDFISELIGLISKKYTCSFYFLPHCIKKGRGNDLAIAKDIKERLGNSIDCIIIEEDMPVMDIKYIISKMDYMIGERTHSIINSISTSTPFVSLTCSADFRTHDIVGEGCGLSKQIYDMDYANVYELFEMVDNTIQGESKLRMELQSICAKHESIKNEFQAII